MHKPLQERDKVAAYLVEQFSSPEAVLECATEAGCPLAVIGQGWEEAACWLATRVRERIGIVSVDPPASYKPLNLQRYVAPTQRLNEPQRSAICAR